MNSNYMKEDYFLNLFEIINTVSCTYVFFKQLRLYVEYF